MGRRPKGQTERLNVLASVASRIPPSDWVDLRDYLAAIYAEASEQLSRYSYKEFSLDLGLGLGNSSWLIIHGKRTPNAQSLERIAAALALPATERKALALVARHTQSKSQTEKEQLLGEILLCRRKFLGDNVARRELDFYREWHHAIIFEMVGLRDFSSDPAWIAQHLNATISPREVQDSLELLESLGVIRYDETLGRHVSVIRDFETSREVPGIGIMRFHQKMIDLGKESIRTVPHQQREIGAVTVAVTAQGMDVIKQAIQSFRQYIMYLASQHSDGADTVMQLNLQLFPIAQTIRRDPEPSGSPDGDDHERQAT